MAHRFSGSLILLWTLLGFSAASAPAAAARWEPLPLWGGVVQLAAAQGNPSIVYAASPTSGLYQSTDGGATWQLRSRGPNGFRVRILGVDPHDPRSVWVAAIDPSDSYQGLFRSEDGGRHWRRSNVGIPGTVYDVAFDSKTPGRVYAAASGGLYRSEDQGASWTRIAFAGLSVFQVAVAPGAPQVVLASVLEEDDRDGTTWRSTDGGATFAEVFDQAAYEYVFDATHPGRLYALNAFSGLSRSEDLGATWTSLSPGGDFVQSLAITPAGTLLAGAYQRGVARSEDGGLTWKAVPGTSDGAPLDSITSFVVRKDGSVLAGGSRGVWKSLADGRSWRASSTGIRGQWVFTLEAADGTEPALWAGTGSGVFKIRDEGGSFQSRLAGPRSDGIIERLAVHPEQTQIAYAFGCCAGEASGLLKTGDGGRTWELLPYIGVLRDTKVLAVDPEDPDIVYAGGLFEPHSGPCTAVRSTDGGATWSCMTPLATFDFTALVFDPRDSRIVYGLFNGRLYRSADRGKTWVQVSSKSRAIDHLTIDPVRPGRFFALSQIGPAVLRSDDGGRSWKSLTAGLPATGLAHDLLLDPSRPDRVWVALEVFEPGQLQKSRGRVFRSDDAGNHWTEVSAGLAPGTVVLDLAADPRAADVLYAGTAGQGLYWLAVEE